MSQRTLFLCFRVSSVICFVAIWFGVSSKPGPLRVFEWAIRSKSLVFQILFFLHCKTQKPIFLFQYKGLLKIKEKKRRHNVATRVINLDHQTLRDIKKMERRASEKIYLLHYPQSSQLPSDPKRTSLECYRRRRQQQQWKIIVRSCTVTWKVNKVSLMKSTTKFLQSYWNSRTPSCSLPSLLFFINGVALKRGLVPSSFVRRRFRRRVRRSPR